MGRIYNLILTVNYTDDTEQDKHLTKLTRSELEQTIMDYINDEQVSSVVAVITKY